jgi:hypothetical protein
MSINQTETEIADALRYALVSPNCLDSNWEAANVVDGLYRIADAINNLARAVRGEPKDATPDG